VQFLIDESQLRTIQEMKEKFHSILAIDIEKLEDKQYEQMKYNIKKLNDIVEEKPKGQESETVKPKVEPAEEPNKTIVIKIYGPAALLLTLVVGLASFFIFGGAKTQQNQIAELFCSELIEYRGIDATQCSSLCNSLSKCGIVEEFKQKGYELVSAYSKEMLATPICDAFYCCKCKGTTYIFKLP